MRWGVAAVLIVAGLTFIAALIGLASVVSAYAYYSQQLPEPGALPVVSANPTRLYDRAGQRLLYEIADPSGEDKTWVALPNIPAHLRNATIALEDQSFYEDSSNSAQNAVGTIWGGLFDELAHSEPSITRRLVKNLGIVHAEQSQSIINRHLQELILAVRINQTHSKDEILEWYLNTNFYGNLAYGVEAASQVYFGKPINELTLPEAAMLAAIPQSPELNPIDNDPMAKERQHETLEAMVKQGYITQEQADVAFAAPLEIKPAEQQFDLTAPHFAIAARKQLEDIVGPLVMRRGGLVVYTTLDYPLYLQAECVARTQLARLSAQPANTVIPAEDGSPCEAANYLRPLTARDQNVDHQAHNAAVVMIEAQTGEILAMVGSLDYYNAVIDGNLNMALAERQPGSAMQPFTYLAAFQQGFASSTMMLDIQTTFDAESDQPYIPENFDRQFHGPVSLRAALANSYNVPAVQALNWVGVDNVFRVAHAMGINTLDSGSDHDGLDFARGSSKATLLDMVYAYGVLANQGVMHGQPLPTERVNPGFRMLDPTYILRIEDQAGNILWEYGKDNTFKSMTVVEPSLAYLVTDILSNEEARRPSVGSDSALTLDRPAAATTGDTGGYQDHWTLGYTPQIVTGVWVGNTDGSPLVDSQAMTDAAPIWQAIMRYAHQDLPAQGWDRPPEIIEMTVCQPSGLLPTPYCPAYREIFRRGTEPTAYDDIYKPFSINKDTGLLATVYTPANLVEQRIYQVLPSEAIDWAREAGIPQPPTTYDTLNVPVTTGDVAIVEPSPFGYVGGIVEIKGSTRDAGFKVYRLDYGQGLNPTQWFQIGVDSGEPVSNGLLGAWDTAGLDGLCSLRLTMIRGDNSFQQFMMQVTVDNFAPSIRLARPNDGEQFSLSDEFLTIQPIVADNVAMQRVEFFVDGALVATSAAAPFSGRWEFSAPGSHVIQARAYDAAGNMTISKSVNVMVNP